MARKKHHGKVELACVQLESGTCLAYVAGHGREKPAGTDPGTSPGQIHKPRCRYCRPARLLLALHRRGKEGLTRTEVRRLFSGNVPTDDIISLLNGMADDGFIEGEYVKLKGPGRPTEHWYITRKGAWIATVLEQYLRSRASQTSDAQSAG